MLKLPKLNLTKFKLFKIITLLVLALIAVLFLYFRGVDFKNCIMAQYDLKRDTDFRILTGSCTTIGKDGSLIYINQLRGFGTDDITDHQ